MTTNYYYFNNHILSDEEEDKKSREKIDKWIFRLLLLVIGVLPMIIGGAVKEVISPLITTDHIMSSGIKGDMYTHYKTVLLITITTIITLLFLSKIMFMNGYIKNTKLNLFVGIFTVAVILSTILSPSKSIALWGLYNRSDGAISYLCYILLFFIAFNIDYPKKTLSYVMFAFYPFVLVNIILMTMHFTGNDLFSNQYIQKILGLLLPDGATLEEEGILLGTLNQWNYMSGMFAIMTVMYLAWAIVDINKIRSIINAIIAVISFAITLMSISTSGFLTVVVLTPLLIVLIFKSNNTKKALFAVLAFVILSATIFHILASKESSVWDESIGFFIKKNPYVEVQAMAIDANKLKLSLENTAFAAEDRFELPELPERGIAAGSGRAYIWQKTFELTMNRPLFGFGLDTLVYHFPHYQIEARAGMWDENTIVDKPHNMYIDIFYGTGIVGIIGFAGLALLTVLAAMKIVFKRRQAMIAVFAVGWLAFLFQALFNDSLPGTAGPMWAIAGMMMALLLINIDVEEKTDGRND